MDNYSVEEAQEVLDTLIAPWVRELGLQVLNVAPDKVVVKMPFDERLCRDSGTVCGQSLMALADTAMVVAIAAASGGYRPMTTVDATTHFMKPLSSDSVICTVEMMRLGRTMAFGHAKMVGEKEGKLIASTNIAYALLGPIE